MRVALLRDVSGIGRRSQIVDVPDGYARNFLFPKKLAELATSDVVTRIERAAARARAQGEKAADAERQLLERLSRVRLTITARANRSGTLFGRIKGTDIALALQKQGFVVHAESIRPQKPIDQLGDFQVPVTLSTGSTEISVMIVDAQKA